MQVKQSNKSKENSLRKPSGRRRQYRTDYEGRMRLAFLRARAQAKFRHEPWDLTYEEFQNFWKDSERFSQKGFGVDSLVMTRRDRTKSWNINNCCIITRLAQLHIHHARLKNQDCSEFYRDAINYGD